MKAKIRQASRLLMLFLILDICTQAPALHAQIRTERFGDHEVVGGEVLVKFRTTSASALSKSQSEVRLAHDIDVMEGVGSGEIFKFHSRTKDATSLVKAISARPDVAYAEPNFIVHVVGSPNDPSFGSLWGLQNTGQTILGLSGSPGADINVVPAWDLTTGSTANVIAVVDTGIDYNHQDLAANVWSAPSSFTVNVGGNSILCPAGSHGFNAIVNSCDPLDDNQHGTHVSGTIGAVGNNNFGVAGVNWTASIMASKFLDSTGKGTTANAINAIEFAIQAKNTFGAGANVRVLSNSWGGGPFSQALSDEIYRANVYEMLFVAAAGNNSSNNDSTPFYPAGYSLDNVIAVAATDQTDSLASFSNFGASTVHLGAPGVNVFSTLPNGNFGFLSGTSMATPHVSGAAALLLSACPLLTSALKASIIDNVDHPASLAGLTITGGRLNVNRSLNHCMMGNTPLTLINGWSNAPYSTSNATVGAFNGIVYLKGAIANGTAPQAFVLPALYRPQTDVYVPVDLCRATKGRLHITPDGTVEIQAENSTFSNATCFTSLDGASFALWDNTATPLQLINGWTNAPYSTSNATVQYIDGIIHFKGAIANGNGQPFVLPGGQGGLYTPYNDVYIPVDMCNAANGRLHIKPDGTVSIDTESGNFGDAQCFTSLDGASYSRDGGGFKPLTLLNGWTNAPYGASNAAFGYIDGMIRFKGAIANGTASQAFWLPAGYRPGTDVYIPVDLCNAKNGRLHITPDGIGTIETESGSLGDAQCFTSLDGASFRPL